MKKINFIIPENNNNIKNVNLDVGSKTTIYKNSYTQITTNVYKFNTVVITDDIYVIFSNAYNYKITGDYQKSLLLFKECETKITNNINKDLIYNIYINLALINTELNNSLIIISEYYKKAIEIYDDRAEPYYYWALECNKQCQYDKAYELLQKALEFSYDKVVLKYPLTQFTSYGKYLYDALSVSCFWLKKYEQCKLLLEKIINDPDINSDKNRLTKNLKLTNEHLYALTNDNNIINV